MPGEPEASRVLSACPNVVELMHILGSRLSFEIIAQVTLSARSVTALSDQLGWRVSQVSRNLGLLDEHGLLTAQRHKRYRIYGTTDRIAAIHRDDVMHLAAYCANGDWLLLQANVGYGGRHGNGARRRQANLQLLQRCASALAQ